MSALGAVISVLASDGGSAAAGLYGTFDASNRSFLEQYLATLDGDVVIDCRHATLLDESATVLDDFREAAVGDARNLVITNDDQARRAPALRP